MEAPRQFPRCATAGCNSIVMSDTGIHCLKHNPHMMRITSNKQNSSSASSATSTQSPNVSFNPSFGGSRNPRATEPVNGLSQNVHHTSRGSFGAGSPSMDPRKTVRNTHPPADMLNKHALTEKKTIGGYTAMPRSHLKSSSPQSFTSATGHSQGQYTSRLFSQTSRSPDKAPPGTSAQNGVQPGFRPSANGESQRKAARISSSVSPSSARAVSQVSPQDLQSSRSSAADHSSPFRARLAGASRIAANHRTSDTREEAKASSPSTSFSGRRDLRSIPVVKTNFRPPTSIKRAPPVDTRSPGKREMDTTSGSISICSSSEDESDEDDLIQSTSATTVLRETQAAGPSLRFRAATEASSAGEADADAHDWAAHNGSVDNNIFSGMPNIHNFIPDPDGPSTFAPNNPFLIAGRDASHQTPDNDEARTVLPTIENQETRASMEHSSVLESENQRVFFEADEQWRTRPSVRKRKTCEQRRLELCVEFDEAQFDAAIYGQPEASKPPAGVSIPADPIYHGPAPAAGEAPKPFYMRIDPRIHWPHDFSDEWYARKIKEVVARGGRKANFGKATQRMREQSIAEERLEAQEAAEKAAAEREGEETPSHNPPVPWSHRRPMDFGDVPEDELPSYVQNNKDWLRAAASMRENRQRTLQANALQAAGKPWEHLFLKDKNGRYINQHNEADE